jgi:hypothetical protein
LQPGAAFSLPAAKQGLAERGDDVKCRVAMPESGNQARLPQDGGVLARACQGKPYVPGKRARGAALREHSQHCRPRVPYQCPECDWIRNLQHGEIPAQRRVQGTQQAIEAFRDRDSQAQFTL